MSELAPITFHRTPPVGISAWHRHWVRGQIAGEAPVPCGDCSVCCSAFEYVPLSEEDDPTLYQTQEALGGEIVLAKNDDGSCIYLVDHRCSIHDHRPRTCRMFDCRIYNLIPENDTLDRWRWANSDARRCAEQLRDTTREKFELLIKEPADATFAVRFWVTFVRAANARHQEDDMASILQMTFLSMAPLRAQAEYLGATHTRQGKTRSARREKGGE